jgi:hypothetical protein
MTVPMIGNWRVKVLDVRPFTIHGDLYYELKVVRDESSADQMALLRVPQHAFEATPTSGQVLNLSFLMGQVVSAKLDESGARPEPEAS